ncbi:splicing factor 3B subunit 1-like [Diadema setosum]|uniref:splicing factor 3B subunit 1-like n=1 Tax=Diadema setosum TaxID=31175 RepID=UPI003B3A8495
MALGVFGFSCEDALVHLLNFVWPNVFERSPHVIQAVMEAIEGLRVGVGSIKMLQYTLQCLFHPARKVCDTYWRIYNTLYIGAQDSLVAAFPRVPNDEKNQYLHYELDYVLCCHRAPHNNTSHSINSWANTPKTFSALCRTAIVDLRTRGPGLSCSSQEGGIQHLSALVFMFLREFNPKT